MEMTPGDTQELYKGTIQKIVDRWRDNDALKDPDVDWVSSLVKSVQKYLKFNFREKKNSNFLFTQ